MQKYTFTIQLDGQVQEAPRSETLRDDAAALGYACDMARELRNSGGCHDPNLMIKVRDENRQIIFSIPWSSGLGLNKRLQQQASRRRAATHRFQLMFFVFTYRTQVAWNVRQTLRPLPEMPTPDAPCEFRPLRRSILRCTASNAKLAALKL